jgi:hypothetical protein
MLKVRKGQDETIVDQEKVDRRFFDESVVFEKTVMNTV